MLKDHIVIIGIDQIGSAMLKALSHKKDEIIAIDFNPETVSYWKEKGYNTVFGDIVEFDVIERGALEDARVVISTIPTVQENLVLINRIKSINPNVHIIINAERKIDRKILEDAGADMVIEPFDLVGQMLSRFIEHPELKVRE
jgi:Trk K+ transport system NAD-binding subunit